MTVTPQQARDRQWERAKRYREERRLQPLPVSDVVSGETVLVECDETSRRIVADLAQAATWKVMAGEDLDISFTDGANQAFTVDAQQTIALKASVTLNDSLCHAASQNIRAALDAAFDAGASSDEIFGIDITAGYPDP